MSTIQIDKTAVLLMIIVLLATIWMIFVGIFWLKALLSGISITPTQIIFMRIRNTPVNLILTEQIKAAKAGVLINRDDLEACHLTGGNVKNVVGGLIFSKATGIDLSVKEAMQLDLQKHDIINHLRNKK
ncbi:MAG: flotillin-like FloA family protein [Candidatus Delongbacteria bacterium]|nr:flotillin-like FloA family protein [Candidatus Delongbacteria bacterium]MBN2819893.1 flotillin-like FloA family protein [Bacteroidales bacterium]